MRRISKSLTVAAITTFTLATALVDLAGGQTKPSVRVAVIGVYRAARDADRPRPAPGTHERGEISVRVVGDQPTILVLTAYEPVLWKIDDPRHSVTRVIASGYHVQSVEGIAREVELKLLSYEGGEKDEYFYAYRREAPPDRDTFEQRETKDRFASMEERVRALTGQGIDQFQGSYYGKTFEVGGGE